jgi:hypothetical protein
VVWQKLKGPFIGLKERSGRLMDAKQRRLIKGANSKGALVKYIDQLQKVLAFYANESNWAVKEEDIIWLGDDDPTYQAGVVLGVRKPDSNYLPTVVKQKMEEAAKNEQLRQQQSEAEGRLLERVSASPDLLEPRNSGSSGPEVREG